MDKRRKFVKPTREGKSKKRAKDGEVKGQGGKEVPRPHAGRYFLKIAA